MGLSRASQGHGPDLREILVSFSSSFWNFVHKSTFFLDGIGVVIDVTGLLVLSVCVRHADVVSVPEVDASWVTRVECIAIVHFPDESDFHHILNIVEAAITGQDSLGVQDQLIT